MIIKIIIARKHAHNYVCMLDDSSLAFSKKKKKRANYGVQLDVF